jgi:AcrR family transcriptional regulator
VDAAERQPAAVDDSTPPRRAGRRRDKEVLEVAAQLFFERGYSEASVQDVAEALGMLKGSLYYYIQSKEDLLFDVISAVHKEGLEVVRARSEIAGDPLDRLSSVIRGHVEHTCRNLVPTAVFLHELSALPAERRKEILGSEHAYQGVFRDLVEEGQKDGLVRADLDPRLAALSVLGSTNWVYRWFRPGGAFTPEQIGSEMADLAIRGIATEEALQARAS